MKTMKNMWKRRTFNRAAAICQSEIKMAVMILKDCEGSYITDIDELGHDVVKSRKKSVT